jgi:hypothetical protein
MSGYLDSYGVADRRREGLIKRVAIGSIIVIVVGLAVFFILHNLSERRVANRFLDAVRAKDYALAYRDWGCATPCKDYPLEKFMEDWGPNGVYKNAAQGHFTTVDTCGEGVVLTLEMPGVEPVGLWVDRQTQTMSYAPWPRCPGRHLHVWEFIKSKFS